MSRPRLTPEERRQRIRDLLRERPGITANDVRALLGGNRADVLRIVREERKATGALPAVLRGSQEQALAPLEELRALDVITPTGLLLPVDISYERWAALGAYLGGAYRAVRWAVGDWQVYGEARFGELDGQALEATGFGEDFLRDLRYIAKSVPRAVRTATLSISHHRLVAPLGVADQRRLLGDAVANGWTVERLREAIRAERDEQPEHIARVEVLPPAEVVDAARGLVAIGDVLEEVELGGDAAASLSAARRELHDAATTVRKASSIVDAARAVVAAFFEGADYRALWKAMDALADALGERREP